MKPEFVRNPYNYDSDKVSEDTGLKCKDKTLTEQQHIEEADINYIAERFMRTGELQQVIDLPRSGDFAGIFDFQSAMNTIVEAKRQFMALPAKLRTRFSNDPQELISFLDDPENYDEAVRLKLVEKRETIESPTTTTRGTHGTSRENSTESRPQEQTRDTRTPEASSQDKGGQKPRSKAD